MNRLTSLFVGTAETPLGELASALSGLGQRCVQVGTAAGARRFIRDNRVEVAVIAAQFPDQSEPHGVAELAAEQPGLNCTLVSPLDRNKFHRRTEGLGVFMQVPPVIDGGTARHLLDHPEKIYRSGVRTRTRPAL